MRPKRWSWINCGTKPHKHRALNVRKVLCNDVPCGSARVLASPVGRFGELNDVYNYDTSMTADSQTYVGMIPV
jgi:hypothetical protein